MLDLFSLVLLCLFLASSVFARVGGGWVAGEIGNIAISAQIRLQAGSWAELGNSFKTFFEIVFVI